MCFDKCIYGWYVEVYIHTSAAIYFNAYDHHTNTFAIETIVNVFEIRGKMTMLTIPRYYIRMYVMAVSHRHILDGLNDENVRICYEYAYELSCVEFNFFALMYHGSGRDEANFKVVLLLFLEKSGKKKNFFKSI